MFSGLARLPSERQGNIYNDDVIIIIIFHTYIDYESDAIRVTFWVGFASNLLSISLASLRLLFLLRDGSRSDPSPCVRCIVLLLPMIMIVCFGNGILWISVFSNLKQIGILGPML